MSASDASATIGYGFLVPKKIADESSIDLEDLFNEKESKIFDFMFFGDSFSDNYQTFIIIKESEFSIHAWEDKPSIFDPQKLKAKSLWNKKLIQWSKKYNINKPKIGWYLCVSI